MNKSGGVASSTSLVDAAKAAEAADAAKAAAALRDAVDCSRYRIVTDDLRDWTEEDAVR